MALSDHLRELRARVLKIAVIIVTGLIVALVFHNQLFDVIYDPYAEAADRLSGETQTEGTITGAGSAILLYMKICGFASLVLTSPLWLYQIWAFILPGLHPKERKITRVFAGVAGPLFLVGVALAYVTLPKGLEVLIGFTPDGLTNLIDFNDYLQFFTRTMLVFGIAFEIPVFVVLLNQAGVLKGRSLGAHRPWMIISVFIFAAVATPSTDPFTMTFMAVPMVLLFLISEVICRISDNRREARRPNAGLSPDEKSSIS